MGRAASADCQRAVSPVLAAVTSGISCQFTCIEQVVQALVVRVPLVARRCWRCLPSARRRARKTGRNNKINPSSKGSRRKVRHRIISCPPLRLPSPPPRRRRARPPPPRPRPPPARRPRLLGGDPPQCHSLSLTWLGRTSNQWR